METSIHIGLSPEILSEISDAYKENDYITIIGDEVNTKGAVGFLLNTAKDDNKKIVQIDVPKPKDLFTNDLDNRMIFDLFKKSFYDADLELADVDSMQPNVFNSLRKSIMKGIQPTLVVLANIQNLPNDYGEGLILFIRSIYQIRTRIENARNIQFVLVGEKDPNEIRNTKSRRTPYNIGTKVRL